MMKEEQAKFELQVDKDIIKMRRMKDAVHLAKIKRQQTIDARKKQLSQSEGQNLLKNLGNKNFHLENGTVVFIQP